MRELVVSTFITLDGVMQAPGKADEDTEGGFTHGGWQLSYFDEVFGNAVLQGFQTTDALLLGRKTYEIFASHWPHQPADDPVAPQMNAFDKYVVSTTMDTAEWVNSRVIKGDAPAEIGALKNQPGKTIRVFGSGQLVQTLIEKELVDRFELMIHPLVLGGGKRLFRDQTAPLRLRLVDSTVSTTGVVIVSYEPEWK